MQLFPGSCIEYNHVRGFGILILVDLLNKQVTTTGWCLVMSKRCQFSLLNDEQMSNWLGVEQLPAKMNKCLLLWNFYQMIGG